MRDLLFAGELNVDLVLTGVRQAPAFGTEILAEDYAECLGSSTAICACAAASLGLTASIYGRLGTDRFGSIVVNTLQGYGIDTSLIDASEAYRTGLTVSISAADDRALVTCFGDTIDSFDAEEIPLEAADARHLHMGSYFLQPRVRKNLPALYEKAKKRGMTTSLDAGWDEFGRWNDGLPEILRFTDFFFPNEKEACAIAGTEDVLEAAVRIARMGAHVMVKCGPDGAVLCPKGSAEPKRFAPFHTRVVDSTGAGDSFNAGALYAFLKGLPLEECVRYGNATGAVSLTRPGGTTACPTLSEVERTLRTGSAV
jgi:sugar/nucleoside kinase (ribokinase family)